MQQQQPQVVNFTELEQARLEASMHRIQALHAQQQAANVTAALLQHEIPKAQEAHNALVAAFTEAAKARDAAAVGNAELVGKLPGNREQRRRAGRLESVKGNGAAGAPALTPEQAAEAAAMAHEPQPAA